MDTEINKEIGVLPPPSPPTVVRKALPLPLAVQKATLPTRRHPSPPASNGSTFYTQVNKPQIPSTKPNLSNVRPPLPDKNWHNDESKTTEQRPILPAKLKVQSASGSPTRAPAPLP